MRCGQCNAALGEDELVCSACGTRQEFDLQDSALPVIGGKLCFQCGGRLEGNLKSCPFCDALQGIDLRGMEVHHHGPSDDLYCPDCAKLLHVITIEASPMLTIERCPDCLGMFFDHGEVEQLLLEKTHDLPKVDKDRITRIAEHYGHNHRATYLPCPVCQHSMSHRNFGGNSGVILDRCVDHGLWIQGGELRRLMEWWASGGKKLRHRRESALGGVLPPPSLKAPPRRDFLLDPKNEPEGDPWTHERFSDAVLDTVGDTLFKVLGLFHR